MQGHHADGLGTGFTGGADPEAPGIRTVKVPRSQPAVGRFPGWAAIAVEWPFVLAEEACQGGGFSFAVAYLGKLKIHSREPTAARRHLSTRFASSRYSSRPSPR